MSLRINGGSGQRRFDTTQGWCNVDAVSREGEEPDVVADCANLPKDVFPDECAEMVVYHHLIEHSHLGEADGLIREAWRVLQPGGRLLVFVPDIKKLAERWLRDEIDDYIFFVNVFGAYRGLETDTHKWGWHLTSVLHWLNQTAAWRRVMPFDWRPITGADIARDWWIAGAECVK